MSRPDPTRAFDYGRDYAHLDLRAQPELYRVGRGEQGVLLVRPYKDELLPLWRFRTPAIARASADAIFDKLLAYLRDDDFVGADMAREFLQMGYTRARRYANHAGGKKYRGPVPADRKGKSGAHGRDELPRRTGASSEQRAKAEAAAIFEERWDEAARHPAYVGQREVFRALFG